MSEKDVYIGETSIQIGQHGFINQPKEIIEYIKYLQNQLQQKENIIKEVREYIKQRTEFGEYTYAYPGVLNQDEVREINRILDKGE